MTVRSRLDGANNMMCNDKKKRQGGFTLIEVIIAILILAMAIVGFVPLYSYVHSNLIMNRTKVVAYNLAKNRVEEIKSKRWDDIGTTAGNPRGLIPVDDYVTYPNDPIKYYIKTIIQWMPDVTRSIGDLVITDYKVIEVNVQAYIGDDPPDKQPKKIYQDITVKTKVSMEGEEQSLPGGNIIVTATKGWNLNPAQPILVPDVDITITGPSYPSGSTTPTLGLDSSYPGEVFFPLLTPGIYTMNADASGVGMMVMPGTAQQNNINVTDAGTSVLSVEVAKPCHLNLKFQDGNSGQPVDLNGNTVTLEWPSQLGVPDQKPSVTGPEVDQSVFGDLWPVGYGWGGAYHLTVSTGLLPYNNYDISYYTDWDGMFDNEGENRTVTINLVPSPQITVVDGDTGEGVSNATVRLYIDRHTYLGGAWGYPVKEDILNYTQTSGITGSDGTVFFKDLPNNEQASLAPDDGYTYTTYRVEVVPPVDYQIPAPIDDAFWVKNGYQMACQGGQQTDNRITDSAPLTVSLDKITTP